MEYIKGGYYMKARQIQESSIAHAPPCTREVWDYLLMMANHSDNKICERGQHVTSVSKLREALHWYAGWRKETYKKSACENAVKWLKKAGMITTTKTTRGMIITVCNYSLYQDPKNYESRTGKQENALHVPEHVGTINKNEKNIKNKEENIYTSPENFGFLDKVAQVWNEELGNVPPFKPNIQFRDETIKLFYKDLRLNKKMLDLEFWREYFKSLKDDIRFNGKGNLNNVATLDSTIRKQNYVDALNGQFGGNKNVSDMWVKFHNESNENEKGMRA